MAHDLPGLEPLEPRRLCSAVAPALDVSSVTLKRIDNNAPTIARRQVAWIVIHGLAGAATNPGIQKLAKAVDASAAGDQVFVLDWQALAVDAGSGHDKERNAQAAADVVAAKLRAAKIPATRINLIGFSMGGLVADRIAKDLHDRGGVNAIVGIDPASPKFGKRPDGSIRRAPVDLRGDSQYSIAFYGPGGLSARVAAVSTDATVMLQLDPNLTPGARHAAVFEMFTKMTERNAAGNPDAVSTLFSLNRIAAADLPRWRADEYGQEPGDDGGYEAILTSTGTPGSSLAPGELTFKNPRGHVRHVRAT